ncbi:hypothetical protein [Catellatospora methionotrophica]|uniref:hypothetical protein n=1 Tax=Catellatospora methionotrophica TaxID=121620 RepID=UPI001408F29A|nr:hypothetical protein [Catellatospora methionotrophica]
MSKERKLRREAREEAARRAVAAEERRAARRLARRAAWRRLSLYELRKRSAGRLASRRTAAERAGVAIVVTLALFVIWTLVPSTALAVALTLLLALTLPVFVIVAFDRRSS